MRRILCTFLMLVLFSMPGLAVAQDDEQAQGGFYGDIILGGGLVTGKPSQLEVTDDNEIIDGLDERAESMSEAFPFIMAEVGYRFADTGTEISVGNQLGQTGEVALSVRQSLQDWGDLGITLGYACEEVWENPYLVGVKRDDTKEITTSLGLTYENILGSGALLSIGSARIEVDDDLIGAIETDLDRDGEALKIGAGYVFTLNEKNILTPRIDYIDDNRDGDSHSSKNYRMSLNHTLSLGKLIFISNFSFGMSDFEKEHPIFNRTRDEKTYDVFEYVTYAEPFGWNGFSLNGLIAYSYVDSDIRFFESDLLVVGLGIGYNF